MTIVGFDGNGSNKSFANNSGKGTSTPVLDIVSKQFNWGAFLLGWIWGLGNKCFFTLMAVPIPRIPYVGLIINFGLCVWFGIKGNEWAWQNKKWESVEVFQQNQRKWAIAGIIFHIVLIFAIVTLYQMMTDASAVENINSIKIKAKKQISIVNQAVLLNEALENKCQLTSNGLAACFAKRMNTDYVDGNSFNAADGSVWTFNADGKYYIKIDVNGVKGPNKEETDIITIPLHVKSNGYLEIKEDEIKT